MHLLRNLLQAVVVPAKPFLPGPERAFSQTLLPLQPTHQRTVSLDENVVKSTVVDDLCLGKVRVEL